MEPNNLCSRAGQGGRPRRLSERGDAHAPVLDHVDCVPLLRLQSFSHPVAPGPARSGPGDFGGERGQPHRVDRRGQRGRKGVARKRRGSDRQQERVPDRIRSARGVAVRAGAADAAVDAVPVRDRIRARIRCARGRSLAARRMAVRDQAARPHLRCVVQRLDDGVCPGADLRRLRVRLHGKLSDGLSGVRAPVGRGPRPHDTIDA